MKAIILSAGQGTRLLPWTRNRPKCLLPLIEETTILGWQLARLSDAGVNEVVVVSGYRADLVGQELEKYRSQIQVRSLYNPDFQVWDNLGSVWRARGEMDEPFLLLNGDTLFTTEVAERLCARVDGDIIATIARKEQFTEDDMKVSLSGNRLVAVGKGLSPAQSDAESIGLFRFSADGARRFQQQVRAMVENPNGPGRRYYLSALHEIAREQPLEVMEAAQDQWQEVDFPEDWEAARDRVRAWSEQLVLRQSGESAITEVAERAHAAA